MEDERINLDILMKGKKYPLVRYDFTVDFDKRRLHCVVKIPLKASEIIGKEFWKIGHLGFYIPIEFDETTRENLQKSEHIT